MRKVQNFGSASLQLQTCNTTSGVSKMKSLPNKSRLVFCKVVGPMVLGASNKCFGVEASIVARIGSVGSWTGKDCSLYRNAAFDPKRPKVGTLNQLLPIA